MRSLVAAGIPLVLGMLACGGNSTKGDASSGDGSGGTSGTSPGSGGSSGTKTGGASGTATGGASGVANDWAPTCQRAVAALCPMYEACRPFAAEIVLTPDCSTYVGTTCNDIGRLSGVRVTPAEYDACVEALARLSCDDWAYNEVVPPECAALAGARPTGDPCASDLQCQSGACSTPSAWPYCGLCALVLRGEGESCLDEFCATGFFCNPESRCVRLRRLGEACSAELPCLDTMFCRDGSCARLPGAGEPCADSGFGCDLLRGATCNLETGICEKVPLSDPGEPCTSFCRGDARCVATSPGDAVCTALGRAGDPCPSGHGECDRWHTCTSGVCVAFDPTTCN